MSIMLATVISDFQYALKWIQGEDQEWGTLWS